MIGRPRGPGIVERLFRLRFCRDRLKMYRTRKMTPANSTKRMFVLSAVILLSMIPRGPGKCCKIGSE